MRSKTRKENSIIQRELCDVVSFVYVWFIENKELKYTHKRHPEEEKEHILIRTFLHILCRYLLLYKVS